MEMNFVPECYFDTVLVKSILRVEKVNHQHGCQNVIKEITGSKRLKDDFAVALIDNDKRILKYIKNECKVEINTGKLILLKHKTKRHYVVQLVPAIEKWVLNVIEEGSVDIEDLNLPKELEGLKEFTKYKFANENDEIWNLCKRLIKSDSKTMATLARWLNYLYQHNRNADINVMKQWN